MGKYSGIPTRSHSPMPPHRTRHAARESVERMVFFTVALSGGHSPRELYMALAGYLSRMICPGIDVRVQADERCVPPDDPASNYLMMHAALLSRVPIPEDHVLRIRANSLPMRRRRITRNA